MELITETREQFQSHLEYWEQKLKGNEAVFNFRQGHVSGKTEGATGSSFKRHAFEVTPEHAARVITLSGGNDSVIFNCLLSAIGITLGRYTSTDDVVVATPKFKGLSAENNQDNVPLIFNIKGETTLRQLLNEVREVIAKSYKFQDYPKGTVNMEAVSTNVYLSYKGIHGSAHSVEQYDLQFSVVRSENTLEVVLDYNTNAISSAFAGRFQSHLEQVLAGFAELDTLIREIDLLSAEEHQLIASFNTAAHPHTDEISVVQVFEAMAETNPDGLAVVAEDGTYTYKELNEKANQLANYLKQTCGASRGDVVGVMIESSRRYITSMLGVLKSGAAYLPIDLKYPEDRRRYMLEQSKAKVLISDSEYLFEIEDFEGHMFGADIQLDSLSEDTANPERPEGKDIAYVIFTSGSTGNPKGVMIRHASVVNLCTWHKNTFAVTEKSKATLYSNIAFDASAWEVWPYLLSGAALYPLPESKRLDLKQLTAFLTENGITHAFLPTPICAELNHQELEVPSNLLILTGGDELKLNKGSRLNIVNNYGPTESTVVATSMSLNDNVHAPLLPIGKAIDNIQIHILDADMRPVPVGINGELFISGAGLAAGYINSDELTKEKFTHHNGTRMYATGDIGCWLEDGNILFKGRDDNQVKINGFRIELGEIQSRIMEYPGVEDTVVMVKQDEGGPKYLQAWYVPSEGCTEEGLKQAISKSLPVYMIPSRFIAMERFPLTPNGKVDTKALLSMDAPATTDEDTGRSEEEEKMVKVWKEVLAQPNTGMDDNFFAIGGDSINAIKLVYEVNNTFGCDLKLMDIFQHDTPAKLLAKMKADGHSSQDDKIYKEVEKEIAAIKEEYMTFLPDPDDVEDIYPVADIQMGMLYHSSYSDDKAVYHDQIVHQVKYPDFDADRLRKALELMAEEHEILRTSFDIQAEPPVQIVHKTVAVDYEHTDLSDKTKEEQKAAVEGWLIADREAPFKPAETGLWRVRTFLLSNDTIVTALVCHHAIIDGWSDATFSTEMNNIYHLLKENPAYKPEKAGCSFRDYVVDELVAKKDSKLAAFWKKEFEDYEKLKFIFPLDDENSETKVFNTNFSPELKKDMQDFAHRQNVSPRIVCMAAYLRVIQAMAVNDQLTIGLHTHNRPLHKDSEKLLGCFLNSIPFRYKFAENMTWAEHLEIVNKKMLDLTAYNNLPLMEIVKLNASKLKNNDGQLNPLFDTLFGFLDFHVYDNLIGGGEDFSDTFEREDIEVAGQGINNTHFNFIVNSTMQRFNLLIFYKSTAIDDDLIRYIAGLFEESLRKLIYEADSPIHFNNEKTETASSSEDEGDIDFNL